jgi:hypothetical protein
LIFDAVFNGSSSSAQGGDPCGCNAVLIPSEERVGRSTTEKLATLEIVDESTFLEIRRRGAEGMSLGIYYVQVGADTSWDNFQQQRRQVFRENRFNMEYQDALNTVKTGLRPEVVDAWSRCKSSCRRDGIHCYAEGSTMETVTVTCAWNGAPGFAGVPKVQSSFVSGGYREGVPSGKAFPDNYEFKTPSRETIIFHRKGNGKFELTVNVAGYSTYLPVDPPKPPAPTGSFTISRSTIKAGETVTLKWSIENAKQVVITDIGEVESSGSKTVAPSKDTEFQLRATGEGGGFLANPLKLSVIPKVPDEQYIDPSGGNIERDFHACPLGFAMAGIHVALNKLVCRRVELKGQERNVRTVVDGGTVRRDAHVCPRGMYIRGVRLDRNQFLCSANGDRGEPTEYDNLEGQSNESGIHTCGPSDKDVIRVMVGINVGQNRLVCNSLPR